MGLIKLEHISKIYNQGARNQVDALKDISLEVMEGELVALVGKSGAGKSTLLHILGCLSVPTTGVYSFEQNIIGSHDQKELAYLRNRGFGTVLQDFGLIEYRNVLDNVSVPLLFNSTVRKNEIRTLCMEALEKVDMLAYLKRPVWTLSGGEKQRIAIARALVNRPKVLLADEPTGSLDHYNTRIIMDIFLKLNDEGNTIILVTHDKDIANQCKRIVTVEDGKISMGDRESKCV